MDCFFVVLKCRVCEIFRTFRFSRFLHVSFFKSSTFRFAGFKNVDWDCDTISSLMFDEMDIIQKLLADEEYQTAALMFMQLTKSMCRHFVIDRHWEYFDDVYSPEYALDAIIKLFEELVKEGKLPKDVNTYLHEAWEEISDMESCKDYGIPSSELPF